MLTGRDPRDAAMNDQDSWYRQDAFWELVEPVLFNQQRQARAIEEVKQIVTLLQMKEGFQILDLCCGTGRHSLELSRRGYDVVGVDRTAAFIKKAE
jgi:ubiquinone/menaquinone biosynthesis C-methylase UbiE